MVNAMSETNRGKCSTRSEHVALRLRPGERALLERAAEEAGQALSTWIRTIAVANARTQMTPRGESITVGELVPGIFDSLGEK